MAGAFGVVLFGVLALLCRWVAADNEQGLLDRQTDQAAAALTISIGQLRAPLEGLAHTAGATSADPSIFMAIAQPLLEATTPFRSVEVFAVGSPQPLGRVGPPSRLATEGVPAVEAMLRRSQAAPFVAVDLLDQERTLGLAVIDDAAAPRYVAYGERALPADPNVRRRAAPPFDQLQYAVYLGDTESEAHLLGSSLRTLPITGRRSTVRVPFGDSQILLVATPVNRLEGWLLAHLWWIVLAGGLLATGAAVALLRRLDRTRARALANADDAARQRAQQQQIAETLQRSLLPQQLIAPPDSEIASRYWPAGSASLIGGDFYDAFRIDDGRWAIVIGDVCGKGIDAAALTGLVRHTIRTASRHIATPTDVLHAVHAAMLETDPSTYITVCLVIYAPAGRPRPSSSQANSQAALGELTVVLGGHPQPLLVRDGDVRPIGTPGTVVGLLDEPQFRAERLTMCDGDTLVLYTDGLTDPPGDEGVSTDQLAELIRPAAAVELEQLADSIGEHSRTRRPHGGGDDTALLVVRFTADPAAFADALYATGASERQANGG